MNNKRRIALRQAIRLLTKASDILQSAADEEQDALDNIPANLEGSSLFDTMSQNVETLEDAAEAAYDLAERIGEL